MNVTNPRAYASLSTLPSSQNLSVDPRLVQQHGPRPPGGLRFLKDHFPDRQSGGRHYHAPVEIADSASVALGLLPPIPSSPHFHAYECCFGLHRMLALAYTIAY